MFVRDHLALVAQWARGQLLQGPDSADVGAELRQLVVAAEALRERLASEPAALAENVISLADFRRRAS